MSGSRNRKSSSLPPARPGNKLAVTHGAYTPTLISPQAEALVEHLFSQFEHLKERDRLAVSDYAVAQVQVWRLMAYLEKNSPFDARGRPRPAFDLLRRWLDRTDRARARLGLDPASRMSLGVEESLIYERMLALIVPTDSDTTQAAITRGTEG
jgi:hypothetical protein